jgi:nucleoside-diphosphate-sugar epimerase
MRVTILRLPVVYGPRDRGNVRRLIDAVARGRFVIPGSGANVKTMVGVENVAHAAVSAAVDPRASGKIFIVTDERPSSLAEIVAVISSALKVRRSPPRIPVSVLTMVAAVADGLRRATGLNLPITGDQVAKLAANTRYSGERIRNELNLQYPARLEDGMAAAIAGYRRDLPSAATRPAGRT